MTSYLLGWFLSKRREDNKCWQGCEEKQTLAHCWWECNLVQTLWNTEHLKNWKQNSYVVQQSHYCCVPKRINISASKSYLCFYVYSGIIKSRRDGSMSISSWKGKEMWYICIPEYHLIFSTPNSPPTPPLQKKKKKARKENLVICDGKVESAGGCKND